MYSAIGVSYDARFDGKDYPVKGPRGRTISLTKLNERTVVQTVKRNGKVVRVQYMTVSVDREKASVKTENKEQGQTCTVTATKQ